MPPNAPCAELPLGVKIGSLPALKAAANRQQFAYTLARIAEFLPDRFCVSTPVQ